MARTLRAESLSFVEQAPFQFVNEGVFDAPPERVFAALADAPGWSRWFKDLLEARWTSAAPFGVGSTRWVKLKTATVDETILAWEPGRRFSFRLDTITLPLVRAMVEDWRLEPAGEGRTKAVWIAAYEPTWLTRLLHPIVRFAFGQQFKAAMKGLARQVAQG